MMLFCLPLPIYAFASICSRSASLPITFKMLDERLKMNPKITKFVLPIGTINMDGSALYLSVALLFLAQIHNMQLGIGEIFTIGYDTTPISYYYYYYRFEVRTWYRITSSRHPILLTRFRFVKHTVRLCITTSLQFSGHCIKLLNPKKNIKNTLKKSTTKCLTIVLCL